MRAVKFLLALGLALTAMTGCATQNAATNTQTAADQNTAATEASTPITINVSEKAIVKAPSDTIDVDVKYPQFGVESVDKQIEEYITSLADELTAQLIAHTEANQKEIEESRAEGNMGNVEYLMDVRMSLNVNYEITQASESGIDFFFIVSTYEGGAHDAIGIHTFMFDPKTGANLPPLSVVDPDPQKALAKLSQVCREKIPAIVDCDADDSMMLNGTEPTFENFRNIVRADKGVRVVFDPYAVAPWAAGYVEVDI